MRRVLLLSAAVLVGTAPAFAQAGVTFRELTGTRAMALGGTGVALSGAALPNPASGAAAAGSLQLYADRAFGLPELQLAGLQANLPTALATVRLDASSFGYADFRATHVGVGAARNVHLGTSRSVAAGVLIGYDHLALGGAYGSAGALGVDVGLRTMLTERMAGGVRATNLLRSKLGGTEPLPRRLTVGLAYAVDARVTVVGEAQQEVRQPTSFSAGVEARVAGPLTVRAGAGSGPQRLALGFGLVAGRLVAEGAFARHEALGWTPAVSLGARF